MCSKNFLKTVKIEYLADNQWAISSIAKWIHGEWGEFDEYSDIDRIKQRYAKTLNKNKIPITWIALDSDKDLLGCVSLFDYDVAGGDELSPWMVALYVEERQRKKGVGKLLVRKTIFEAKEMGFEKLYLFTGQGSRQSYYEKLDWRLIRALRYQNKSKVVMCYQL